MDELTPEPPAPTWRKSSWPGPDGGNCVEVANLSEGRRAVRDSKSPSEPILIVTGRQWSNFAIGVKRYEF
jgi:hypothetical protein